MEVTPLKVEEVMVGKNKGMEEIKEEQVVEFNKKWGIRDIKEMIQEDKAIIKWVQDLKAKEVACQMLIEQEEDNILNKEVLRWKEEYLFHCIIIIHM